MTVETDTTSSASLYERARKVLPGGVSRNTVLGAPQPLYLDHASGFRVTDVEGVERIDFSNNMTALIHGHTFPPIVDAVNKQVRRGTAATLATEVEVTFAEHMVGRSDSFEMLRFVNSGTEAVMAAVKASRAYTGRSMIAKVEGAYHGQYDYVEVSQTANPTNWGSEAQPARVPVAHGTPTGVLNDVVVIPFNDPSAATALLDRYRGQIACVLVDLMPHRVGLSPAEAPFVEALREWTERDGALLVFDEVITFRSQYGGAQEWYDVAPDLTAMGKMIGGGFPAGAVAGSRGVMEVMNPLAEHVLFPHSGTFSANPVTMTAGLVAMDHFDHAAVDHVNSLAVRAKDGIAEAIARTGVPACVTGGGSMVRLHLKAHPPRNYREAFTGADEKRRLGTVLGHLTDEGFIMINTCSAAMSTPMGTGEVDALASAIERGLAEIV